MLSRRRRCINVIGLVATDRRVPDGTVVQSDSRSLRGLTEQSRACRHVAFKHVAFKEEQVSLAGKPMLPPCHPSSCRSCQMTDPRAGCAFGGEGIQSILSISAFLVVLRRFDTAGIARGGAVRRRDQWPKKRLVETPARGRGLISLLAARFASFQGNWACL
jgi:hypothetical protein